MTNSVPYYHVDAFAERPFTGNQAAVLVLEHWPEDAVLLAIGAENMFAETAFVVPDRTGDADYELRWCTPTVEVRMCGHATLAAGFALLNLSKIGSAVRFRTRHVGLLEVRRTEQGYEVALPAIATTPQSWPEATAAMGEEPAEVRRSEHGYTVMIYERETQVRELQPDFRALARLSEQDPKRGGNSLYVVTAPGRETDVVSRAFVPSDGIDEDPVTGTAHAILAPIWAERLSRTGFTAFQASQRGGYLDCRLEGDRVWLGGRCAMVAEGRYYF